MGTVLCCSGVSDLGCGRVLFLVFSEDTFFLSLGWKYSRKNVLFVPLFFGIFFYRIHVNCLFFLPMIFFIDWAVPIRKKMILIEHFFVKLY